MRLFDVIANGDGAPVQQMARQFDLNEDQVSEAIKKILPALTNGMKKNIENNGLDDLMGALQQGRHERYLDEPDLLSQPGTSTDGNDILGHLFGSKEVSRELAARTSNEVGIGSGLLKKMLPIIAGLAMGAMGKQTRDQDLTGLSGPGSASSLGPLMGLLDADGDGSVIDDVLGLAARFLR